MKHIDGRSPYIFGIAGKFLSEEEKKLFTKIKPYGIILFTRNLESREQIQNLNEEIHSLVPGIKIFIDQEGGRVQRIKPPTGLQKYHDQKYFGDLYLENKDEAIKALQENYSLLSSELKKLGFDVACAPVCDLYHESADKSIMGDRTFSPDPDIVAELSSIALISMEANKIGGMVKHIPGHGRSYEDSHKGLPVIKTSLKDLEETDFKVFANLSATHYAMTAHIVYEAIDPDHACTISKKVIDYIREKIGFTGLIMTDDICMKALEGRLKDIAQKSFDVGCDIVLHCSGKIEEMQEICEDGFLYI